jgi:hypothetical protein
MGGYDDLRAEGLAEATKPGVGGRLWDPDGACVHPGGSIEDDAILHLGLARGAVQGHRVLVMAGRGVGMAGSGSGSKAGQTGDPHTEPPSELRRDGVQSIPVLLSANETLQCTASGEVILREEENASYLRAMGQQLVLRATSASGEVLEECSVPGLVGGEEIGRRDLIAEAVKGAVPQHVE